jgi:hypothetical protein
MLAIRLIQLVFLPLASAGGLFDSIFGSSTTQATEPAVLNLPYGSFRSQYNEVSGMLVSRKLKSSPANRRIFPNSKLCSHAFRNIPYAAPPVGDLRWAKPAPPVKQSGTQQTREKPTCPQALINGINFIGTGNESPIGAAINQLYEPGLFSSAYPLTRQSANIFGLASADYPSRVLVRRVRIVSIWTSSCPPRPSRTQRILCR